MARKDLYTVKDGFANGWAVLKVDSDFKHTQTYYVDRNIVACTCFAGNKSTCRHREIVKKFKAEDLIDKGRYYSFDKQTFYEPPKMEM